MVRKEQMKVLVADDNTRVRELLREYLPSSTDEVLECADGDQAVALFREHRPDWVLIDWEMPRMNGVTAIREIVAEFPKANICLVTAFADEDLRAEALAAGATGFVVKDNLSELRTVFSAETRRVRP